jgi:hypothetical protein
MSELGEIEAEMKGASRDGVAGLREVPGYWPGSDPDRLGVPHDVLVRVLRRLGLHPGGGSPCLTF